MENHDKPFPGDTVSAGRKPYRSPIKRERYGFETLDTKGAVALRAATPPPSGGTVAPEPAAPRPTRIILDHETSEILRESGDCFAVVCKASHPAPPGRYALHLVPSTIERIDRAVAVARGELGTRKRPTK